MLRRGGKIISISGPPEPAFTQAWGLNPVRRLSFPALSAGILRKAKRAGFDDSFVFVRADGGQVAAR